MEEYVFFLSVCRWIILVFASIYTVMVFTETKRDRYGERFYLNMALFMALGLALWMGLTPIPWDSHFDRDNFAVSFQFRREYVDSIKEGMGLGSIKLNDPIFQLYQYLAGRIMNYRIWILLLAFVYTGNYLWASFRLSRKYGLLLFLSFVAGFGFFTYGINAIRAGLAFSLLILGISFCESWWRLAVCFVVACTCHISALLPVVVFVLIRLLGCRSVCIGIIVWSVCLVVSFLGEGLMTGLADSVFGNGRADYLVNAEKLQRLQEAFGTVYRTGFRWDFIIFSLLPVGCALGYRYVLRYKSSFYDWILATYLVVNAAWLLVIRLPFTDRTAYLSWFLMPLLMFYPLTDGDLSLPFKRRYAAVGLLAETLLFSFVL